ELPGEQFSACFLPDTSGGGSSFVDAWGNEPLSVCRVRVDTAATQLWHQTPMGGWERTNGPGWTKVGVDLICGNACSPYSAEDEDWLAIIPPPPDPVAPTPEPTTTPPKPPGLDVSYVTDPKDFVIEQTAKGAVAKTVTVTATVKNTGSGAVDNVTFAKEPIIDPRGHIPHGTDITGCAWAAANGITPAKGHVAPPCPIVLTKPASKTNVGTLAPGASATTTYTFKVAGDGDYTIYSLVSGTRAGEAVNSLGSFRYTPDSQLLVFTVSKGTGTTSPDTGNKLLKAGTPYTVKVRLENRSYYRRIIVSSLLSTVRGNGIGGIAIEDGQKLPTAIPDAGAIEETEPNPLEVLQPREDKTFNLVYFSTRSNAVDVHSKHPPGHNGGTRATVTVGKPAIGTLDDDDKVTEAGEDHQVVTAGSLDPLIFEFDDSQPKQKPASLITVTATLTDAMLTVGWHATVSVAKGVFIDLPVGLVTGVPMFAYKYITAEMELWKAAQGHPELISLMVNPIANNVLLVYKNAPGLAMSAAETYATVDKAVNEELNRIFAEYEAGDWEAAVHDISAEGGDGVGQIVALTAGPAVFTRALAIAGKGGVLLRTPRIIQAAAELEAEEQAVAEAAFKETGVEQDVAKANREAAGGEETAKTLARRAQAEEEVAKILEGDTLAEGMVLDPANPKDLELLQAASGIPPQEAVNLADLAKTQQKNLVCRSRGVGAADRLEEGAYLKPYEVKAKNFSPLDEWLFKWPKKLKDLVLLDDRLPYSTLPKERAVAKFGEALQARGLEPGTNAYTEALSRYKTQYKQSTELLSKYKKAANKGYLDLTWDATENPRAFDKVPKYNPRTETRVDFRMRRYNAAGELDKAGRYYVPEIRPKGGHWGAITGDVDWLSFADAEGYQLSVEANTELNDGLKVFGVQHPESASWVFKGLFDFDQKLEYLSGYETKAELLQNGGIGKQVNFEFGADGKIRTVVLDYKASNFTGSENTRVLWRGGYNFAISP
ncbi:MAG: hypothetical protein QOF76_1745, partial [Solirubrobacteraceae bacterium]|nr:hypothetical protein [Solirubrobacteraceae bacterium]